MANTVTYDEAPAVTFATLALGTCAKGVGDPMMKTGDGQAVNLVFGNTVAIDPSTLVKKLASVTIVSG